VRPGASQNKLPAGVPHRVAVFISGDLAIAGQAEEQFSTGLFELGFDVVERNQIAALTNELHLSQAGFIAPETAIQSGRLLGAAGVFVGNAVGERSATWTDTHLSMRLVDTTTGKTMWSVNAHDPRVIGVSTAIETSIIFTTKEALKALKKDIATLSAGTVSN